MILPRHDLDEEKAMHKHTGKIELSNQPELKGTNIEYKGKGPEYVSNARLGDIQAFEPEEEEKSAKSTQDKNYYTSLPKYSGVTALELEQNKETNIKTETVPGYRSGHQNIGISAFNEEKDTRPSSDDTRKKTLGGYETSTGNTYCIRARTSFKTLSLSWVLVS